MNAQTLAGEMVEHEALLLNVAYTLTSDLDKAWDLVQNTYEKAIRNADSFDGGNLRGWLVVILKNTFRNNYRDESRISFSSVEEIVEGGVSLDDSLALAVEGSDDEAVGGADSTSTASAEDIALGLSYSERMERALNALKPEFRVTFLMYAEQEFSYKEISEALNIPMGTVMSRINRAKSILKAELA